MACQKLGEHFILIEAYIISMIFDVSKSDVESVLDR